MLTTQIAYPAYAFDRSALTSKPPYSGTVPMGGKLAIPSSVSIASLGLSTTEGTAIATAVQQYGAVIDDRGGGSVTSELSQIPLRRTR